MKIEGRAKALNFDAFDDDFFAEIFTKEQIVKDFSYEDTIPQPLDILPADYLWYLEHYGSRTVRNMEFQVPIDGNTINIVSFDGLSKPQTACQKYRYHTRTGAYAYRLEEMKEDELVLDAKYLPISNESNGKMLVIDFKENIGSIWQFPSLDDCQKFDLEYKPSLVASSFTEFIGLLKPVSSNKDTLMEDGYKEVESASNVWKKDVLTFTELFYQVLADYENNNPVNFLEFKNEKDFLSTLLAHPENITINEARAVEFFYLCYNWKVKNQKDFTENIQKIKKLKTNLNGKRENYKLSKLKQLTHTDSGYIGTHHNFFKVKLKSTVNGLSRKETFILYKDPNTQQLSFIRRLGIEKENLKLNGIGIFKFEHTWSSATIKKVIWSEIPATIYLTGFEEDFTDTYVDFVKKTLHDASLKEKLEQFIFERYQKIDYPEYLAQNKQTREELEEAHPVIESPAEIWQILGVEFDIHFSDEHTFEIRFEYSPDSEHGLTVCMKNDVLE